MSWLDWAKCNSEPAPINKHDLNIACVIRWKKAKVGIPIDNTTPMKASWLSVERAITFLKSWQKTAAALEIIKVKAEIVEKINKVSIVKAET